VDVDMMWKWTAFALGVIGPAEVSTEGFFSTHNACFVSGKSCFYVPDGLEGALRLAGTGQGWSYFHVPWKCCY